MTSGKEGGVAHNVEQDRSLLADVHVLVEDSTRVEVDVKVDRTVLDTDPIKVGETIATIVRGALDKKAS
jgi:hypothetical protein